MSSSGVELRVAQDGRFDQHAPVTAESVWPSHVRCLSDKAFDSAWDALGAVLHSVIPITSQASHRAQCHHHLQIPCQTSQRRNRLCAMAGAVGAAAGVSKIKGGRWTVGKFFLLGVCRPPLPIGCSAHLMHDVAPPFVKPARAHRPSALEAPLPPASSLMARGTRRWPTRSCGWLSAASLGTTGPCTAHQSSSRCASRQELSSAAAEMLVKQASVASARVALLFKLRPPRQDRGIRRHQLIRCHDRLNTAH